MRSRKLALFFIAALTLMLELSLTKVFDVILTPNLAYMVISCALFSFGLAGIYLALRPTASAAALEKRLSWIAAGLALATVLTLPLFNFLPFDYEQIPERPLYQVFLFLAMYLALVVPFFLSGTLFAVLFSVHADRIGALYFWDLIGAATGCLLIVPLLPPIGPGGILFVAAGFGMFAAALLSRSRAPSVAAALIGLGLIAVPWLHAPGYLDFKEHVEKRGVRAAREEGRMEFTFWDPVSKIDVFDQVRMGTSSGRPGGTRKHVAYDGGTQSSHIFPFDSDFDRLRRVIENHEEPLWDHFWHRGVLVSHYLKRDSRQKVLVIGSAGGQETKAALVYGAARVDAVELVSAVVDLGTGRYAEYNGGIFLDPRVRVRAQEGRSFLRASPERYDIIQIHSNHTSSSIAAGTGAMAPSYLQTADAYREYFSRLSEDGVLHVNHHVFPRMVTTAALAWKQMGRADFEKHVLLFNMVGIEDPLPTLLIKMSPWTAAEVEDAEAFFGDLGEDEIPFELVHHPLDRARSFLSPEFFSGEPSESLERRMEYHIRPATDDRPFFNFLRKRLGRVEPDPATFTDVSTALLLNSQLRKDVVPMDLAHLIVTALVSLLFAFVFIGLPLYASEAGRSHWRGRYASMAYFSCLGAGFIILELVFIQIFMKLVGYPVHTYALVLFTMLFGAGVGSLLTEKLSITPRARWWWPFLGVAAYGALFVAFYPVVFDHFLAAADGARMLVAVALILPLGVFLGMPFPLGILAIARGPRGAVAWAWGLNGLFTVVGGLLSVGLSIAVGFRLTITLALLVYGLAFLSYRSLRRHAAPVETS